MKFLKAKIDNGFVYYSEDGDVKKQHFKNVDFETGVSKGKMFFNVIINGRVYAVDKVPMGVADAVVDIQNKIENFKDETNDSEENESLSMGWG